MKMRIVAGSLKGRKIEAVKGENTRPTTDKIKENVFNIMGQFFDGGVVLDLFAGSGNLGIEALSRGVEHGVFIDKDARAIRTIRTNLAQLGLEARSEVYRNDAFRALQVLAKKKAKFSLIILDPPYGKIAITELLDWLMKHQLLEEEGLVFCEYAHGMDVSYDAEFFEAYRREVYGTVEILILKKVAEVE